MSIWRSRTSFGVMTGAAAGVWTAAAGTVAEYGISVAGTGADPTPIADSGGRCRTIRGATPSWRTVRVVTPGALWRIGPGGGSGPTPGSVPLHAETIDASALHMG